MFQVEVFWVVTPCSVVVVYQRFGGPCCLHLQGDVAGMGNNGQFTIYIFSFVFLMMYITIFVYYDARLFQKCLN